MSKKYTPQEAIAAFWNKVDRTGGADVCWPWRAAAVRWGYGSVRWRGKARRANRVAYEIAHGLFPDELHVLHSCDNPSCCNPAHLTLGTHQDNVDEMKARGRAPVRTGERNPKCRISDAQVLEARAKYDVGAASIPQLAFDYGLSQSQMSRILKRKARL